MIPFCNLSKHLEKFRPEVRGKECDSEAVKKPTVRFGPNHASLAEDKCNENKMDGDSANAFVVCQDSICPPGSGDEPNAP